MTEVETLREENAWLKSQLAEVSGADKHVAVKLALGISGQGAKLLCAMLARPGKVATFNTLYTLALADEYGIVEQDGPRNILRVQLSRVKSRLRELGAPEKGVRSVWGVGYYVTPELAAWVEARL